MKALNLTAPINQLGYGTVGLNAVLAMLELGCEVALWPLGPVVCPPDKASAIDGAMKATGSYQKLAPSVRIAQQFDLAQHVGKGIHAAVVYFERTKLYPNEINHLQNQDVVIASSVWMRNLLVQLIRGPKLAIARPGVDTSIFDPRLKSTGSAGPQHGAISPVAQQWDNMLPDLSRARDGGDPTTFIAIGKWEVRKGHDVLATVFQRAFTPKDNFKLILVTANPFLSQEQHDAWVANYARLGDKVELFHSRLPDQHALARVMARADCGIFLSRAEGWNLDAAEMLAMGKHLIITNYSAHTEFATPENAWLVEIDELEPAYDGKWFYGLGEWARIGPRQLEQAIACVRQVHAMKQSGSLGLNQAGIDSMKRFTWRAFAESIFDAVRG